MPPWLLKTQDRADISSSLKTRPILNLVKLLAFIADRLTLFMGTTYTVD